MKICQQLTTSDHEMVVFCNDSAIGLRAIIAVHDRGILYAPDFIVNAGGIINISVEKSGHGRRTAATPSCAG